MCGIFGSTDYKRYVALYNKNKKRGSFSYGGLFIDNKLHALIKTKGTFDFKGNLELEIQGKKTKPLNSFQNYLGHTQAPTSAMREYTHKTTHPFSNLNWYVAHNGVLSNFPELKKKLKKYKSVNQVDSSAIPALITSYCSVSKKEVDCICKALTKLKGTFGLWIYSSKTGHVYLARSGSTLYADFITNDFSSLPQAGFNPLQEGILYLQTVEGLTSVGTFKPNSPFYTA
jgi:glucosamine 6-phosphate synthetase-like amidotransferase/phosphosugar isomerase protein